MADTDVNLQPRGEMTVLAGAATIVNEARLDVEAAARPPIDMISLSRAKNGLNSIAAFRLAISRS